MPIRSLIELGHIAIGVIATVAMAMTAAWAYPLGRETLFWVGLATAAAVVLMGIGPLRRAWAIDQRRASDGKR